MKITALKAQVKNQARVSVFVDGKYSFSVNQSQLLDLKIRTGLELDEASLAKFKQASDFGKYYERLLNYVTIRPRSEKEVRDYCWRKKIGPEDVELLVEKLKTRNYVNDEYFAKAWVQSRGLGKKTSAKKLRLELKQKGISDDTINSALEASVFDEQLALKNLIAKKSKNSKYANDRQKLAQYLIRQGFSYDTVKQELLL